MAEVVVCLWSQGIEDDDSVVGGGRRSRRIIDNNGGIGGGLGIDDAAEGLETTMEAAGAR